jgi:hypothetical protein
VSASASISTIFPSLTTLSTWRTCSRPGAVTR